MLAPFLELQLLVRLGWAWSSNGKLLTGWMTLPYSTQFQALRTLHNHGLAGIDVIFKLATQDVLDDVSNLSQLIWA